MLDIFCNGLKLAVRPPSKKDEVSGNDFTVWQIPIVLPEELRAACSWRIQVNYPIPNKLDSFIHLNSCSQRAINRHLDFLTV